MIKLLPPRVYNRISAGEVVDKPASIVKELVENSIDAKARNITVEIENGGIDKVKVTDDGIGMEFEDLPYVFLAHATSKIESEEDLFAIKTLGFRGEALASISAVTNITLLTRHKDSDIGYMMEGTAGLYSTPKQIASPVGTTITASNLFYNVPARLKFLLKPKVEENEITNIMQRFSLVNPNI